jgi:hypothetical protein
MAEKKVIDIQINSNAKDVTTDINNAAQATTNLGNATAEAGSKSKTLNDVKNVITGMVPSLKAAENGATGFSTSLKALLANPVVLVITGIVGALKFIYEAFQSNVKIGKEIAAVWEGLSAVGSQVTDAVMGMVRGIVYAGQALAKLITGDVKGASKALSKANEEMSASYDQLTKAVNGTTFAIVRGLEKQQQANNKAKKEQAVRESEINKLLVQSREILTDETASIKDKKKALDEVTKAEKASSAEKVRTAQVDLDILQKKAKALGGQAEIKMKQQIREATIALNEAETENAMTGIKLNKQRKMLLRQEIADGKEAATAAKDRAKEKIEAEQAYLKAKEEVINKIAQADRDYQDSLLTEQEREVLAVTRKYEALYKDAEKYKLDVTKLKEDEIAELKRLDEKQDEQRLKDLEADKVKVVSAQDATKSVISSRTKELEAEKELSEKKKKIAKDEADYVKALEEKKQKARTDALEATADTLGKIANLFGQQTKVGKAAAIAEATIQMYLSAQKAYSSTVGVPVVGPVLAPINAGLAIAAGIKNIKAIASVKTPMGGGANESPNASNSFGAAQPANFNVVGNSGINQLAQLQQQPTKAYVVSGDMTTAQALDRNRIENATLVQ